MKPLTRALRRSATTLPALFLVAFLTLSGTFASGIGTSDTVIAASATPTADGSLVIVAEDRPRNSHPTGEQELRLAGTILDPKPLDPAFARDVNSAFMARQVYRGLTRFDEELQPVPELAQRIEISPDGLTYLIQLRDDARFADGSPITADDVVFSLTRALDPRTAEAEGAALAGPSYLVDISGAQELIRGETTELAGVRAIDPKTVEIRLDRPRATFLMKLASAPASIVDADDVARGGEWWRTPNASGPFVVESWEPEVELRLGPNPNYVGGEPDLKRITFRLGPNAANSFNLYQSDQIDITPVPIPAIDRVADQDSPLLSELDISPVMSTWYIAFRTDVEPMNDPEIRRAVQLAFPRDKFVKIFLDDKQQQANGLIPPNMLGHEWPGLGDDDLEAARGAIANSSYGAVERVPPIQIYGASPAGAETLRDVLEEDLGLKVEVLNVDWPQYNQGLTRKMFPAYELTWVADFPDPETFLWNLFASASPDNYSEYNNPEFDALLEQAAATLDVDDRAALYAEAQQLLLDDNVLVPLSHDVRYTLRKPYIKGLDVTPLGILYLEDIWLEH